MTRFSLTVPTCMQTPCPVIGLHEATATNRPARLVLNPGPYAMPVRLCAGCIDVLPREYDGVRPREYAGIRPDRTWHPGARHPTPHGVPYADPSPPRTAGGRTRHVMHRLLHHAGSAGGRGPAARTPVTRSARPPCRLHLSGSVQAACCAAECRWGSHEARLDVSCFWRSRSNLSV